MIDIIQQRLSSYRPENGQHADQAMKEIAQEVALYGLWRSGFFRQAAFQGGTSLRILHGLPRFSEDLDFILKHPDAPFDWSQHCDVLTECFREFGLDPEIKPTGKLDRAIRTATIKQDSIVNQLDIHYQKQRSSRKLKIKLEIDVKPPQGSEFEYSFLDFPIDFEVCHQDLPSNFSLKIHALLCRPWTKGRDWYDFAWYTRRQVVPNFLLLENALAQTGSWSASKPTVDADWLASVLNDRVKDIDWQDVSEDVQRFLSPLEQRSLSLWNTRFFQHKISRLRDYCNK